MKYFVQNLARVVLLSGQMVSDAWSQCERPCLASQRLDNSAYPAVSDYNFQIRKRPGASCSKLTTSLFNVSLKF